jgi:hypothetical protein
MKPQIPTSLRKWEERAAAARVADVLLRTDRRRARRLAANDELGGGRAPAPTTKREGAFDALRAHPQYRGPGRGMRTEGIK